MQRSLAGEEEEDVYTTKTTNPSICHHIPKRRNQKTASV